jgi:hypothetical protein
VEGQSEILISAGFDKSVIIWNWGTEAILHILKLDYNIKSLCVPHFEQTKNCLLIGSDAGIIQLYHIDKFPPTLKD